VFRYRHNSGQGQKDLPETVRLDYVEVDAPEIQVGFFYFYPQLAEPTEVSLGDEQPDFPAVTHDRITFSHESSYRACWSTKKKIKYEGVRNKALLQLY